MAVALRIVGVAWSSSGKPLGCRGDESLDTDIAKQFCLSVELQTATNSPDYVWRTVLPATIQVLLSRTLALVISSMFWAGESWFFIGWFIRTLRTTI